MDKIILRAWNRVQKIMITDALAIANVGFGDGSVMVDERTRTDDELDWMQFTGKCTDDERKIFAKDIIEGLIKYDGQEQTETIKGEVYFDTDLLAWMVDGDD